MTDTATRSVRPIWLLLELILVVAVLVALVFAVAHNGDTTRAHTTFAYTIPPGTGARIEAGEQLIVFPARLDVRVGDQLVIHNNDTRVVEVGPYTVDRNATLTQTFNRPGTITGLCTIHPSGRVTIAVRA